MRRARALAFWIDLLVPAALADAVALPLTVAVRLLAPGRPTLTAWIWATAAGVTLAAFLLRDARGGRARRWLALEVRDAAGRLPGLRGSIRRSLPLLVPGWNVLEVWPVLRDGQAARPADRRRAFRVVPCD